MSRRRRRPSTPLAILAGACLGLALAGALHLIVMLAVGGLALGLAAATVQIRRYAAELAAGRARTARQHRPPVTITPAAPAPARPRQPYAHDASGLPLDRCPATFGRLRCTRTEAHPERAHRNGPYGWGTGPPSMATIRAAGLEGDELAEALRATLRPAGDRLSSRIPPPAATTGGTP